jgi:acetyl-CoA carboxylase biotin carboxyl carrier protein
MHYANIMLTESSMDIKKIKELIELLKETDIAEIEIHEGNESVKLTKQHQKVQHYIEPQIAHYASPPQTNAVPQTTEVKPAETQGHSIKSPMVGTAYRAASPSSAPFVSVGQTITAGDTVCIIEAMKMFNEVEADKSGVVKAILIQDGEPVEYNQALIVIE